ncbi:unnamed protein product [Nippostrongylus brasiliensis]|uniref:RNA helicase n=1 Tax=Nippostrongylus brasiliensis TaxID=27835 RepID=A0A0N4XP84_NIPBR|nr:unnamed protein product [Nippostrongylus brasiliensis]
MSLAKWSVEEDLLPQLALDKVDFARQADGATVEIFADDDKGMYKQKHAKRWDRKKKRFVGTAGDGQDIKRIRTEDGTWLPASYKTGRYEDWKKKQKIAYRKVLYFLEMKCVFLKIPLPIFQDEEGGEHDGEAETSTPGKPDKFNKWKRYNDKKQQAKVSIIFQNRWSILLTL